MRYIDDETAVEYRTVRISDFHWPIVKTKRDWMVVLKSYGELDTGCYCSHCLNDWDCCGRMYPGHHEVTSFNRRTRSARIRTYFSRNI